MGGVRARARRTGDVGTVRGARARAHCGANFLYRVCGGCGGRAPVRFTCARPPINQARNKIAPHRYAGLDERLELPEGVRKFTRLPAYSAVSAIMLPVCGGGGCYAYRPLVRPGRVAMGGVWSACAAAPELVVTPDGRRAWHADAACGCGRVRSCRVHGAHARACPRAWACSVRERPPERYGGADAVAHDGGAHLRVVALPAGASRASMRCKCVRCSGRAVGAGEAVGPRGAADGPPCVVEASALPYRNLGVCPRVRRVCRGDPPPPRIALPVPAPRRVNASWAAVRAVGGDARGGPPRAPRLAYATMVFGSPDAVVDRLAFTLASLRGVGATADIIVLVPDESWTVRGFTFSNGPGMRVSISW